MITKEKTPSFELILRVKDTSGKPTGMTKSIKTDDPIEIGNFCDRNGASFWEDRDISGGFLLDDVDTSKPNKSKDQKSTDSAKYIILKKIEKLKKANKDKENSNIKARSNKDFHLIEKVVTDETINIASNIIHSIADLIRTKIKIMSNSQGAIILEFNSYGKIEQSLELICLGNEISYNFWNGIIEDQEYSDYKELDRVKIRQLIEKFNRGLAR